MIALASVAAACRSEAFTIWFGNGRSWRIPSVPRSTRNAHSGQLDPFAKPSRNGSYLRIVVIHGDGFERPHAPTRRKVCRLGFDLCSGQSGREWRLAPVRGRRPRSFTVPPLMSSMTTVTSRAHATLGRRMVPGTGRRLTTSATPTGTVRRGSGEATRAAALPKRSVLWSPRKHEGNGMPEDKNTIERKLRKAQDALRERRVEMSAKAASAEVAGNWSSQAGELEREIASLKAQLEKT
jgi:hypothetical protein